MGESDDLLEPEFRPHYEAWKSKPSPQTSSALLGAVRPVLDSAVRSYGGAGTSPTLRSRAKLMALDALGNYDPSRAKLRTHLMVQLQGLRRASAKEQQMISIPERVALDLHRLGAAEGSLRDSLNRDPSDAELSEHVGLSPARIGYIRQARPAYAEGTIHGATSGDEDQGEFNPAVRQQGPDTHMLDFVYHDLDPADQVIMEHTLGLRNKPVLPKQQIAAKLGMSPAAVSQRAARIQAKLNALDDAWPIGGG